MSEQPSLSLAVKLFTTLTAVGTAHHAFGGKGLIICPKMANLSCNNSQSIRISIILYEKEKYEMT